MSAPTSIARASSSFIFQPPESEPTASCCFSSEKPTSRRAAAIDSRVVFFSMRLVSVVTRARVSSRTG
jgi:hypothetical protein